MGRIGFSPPGRRRPARWQIFRLAGSLIILVSALTRQPLALAGDRAPPESTQGTAVAVSGRLAPRAAEVADLGRLLFSDPKLSASGRLSCASCHDPALHYGPSGPESVHTGGRSLRSAGLRAVPSLAYGQAIPAFSEHYAEDDGNDAEDQGPAGGRDWDGRTDSAQAQARGPLFSPFEMANADESDVIAKVAVAPYAEQFRAIFGQTVFADPDRAIRAVLQALEAFQEDPEAFYPYSSKFDAVLRHQAVLTSAEARGRALFDDQRKGNCALCHPSSRRGGALPQFTDFGLVALGVPRNPGIPANADPHFFDLGLCGPLREDLRDHPEYCGLFKTPTLRNVAVRRVFFHNGIYHRLEDVLRFYAHRDTAPGSIYPRDRRGRVKKFNDLPRAYWGNVNVQAPFNRARGGVAALTDPEMRDIIAFLRTLTDGYQPTAGARR